MVVQTNHSNHANHQPCKRSGTCRGGSLHLRSRCNREPSRRAAGEMPSASHRRTRPQSAMGDDVWDGDKHWEPPTSTTTITPTVQTPPPVQSYPMMKSSTTNSTTTYCRYANHMMRARKKSNLNNYPSYSQNSSAEIPFCQPTSSYPWK